MTIHQKLVNEIAEELEKDDNVQALILYGSVSRNEESKNSDIDLLMIVKEHHLMKRHVIRDGITVEFVEEHIDILSDFIDKYELPMIFALAKGKVLFSKITQIEELVQKSREIIAKGPRRNLRWQEEYYRRKRCSDLTEIYLDMLDVEDDIEFSYLTTVLINSALPMLNEEYYLWPQTRKKEMKYLENQCNEAYKPIKVLLSQLATINEKRTAAKELIDYIFKRDGGLLEGEAIIFYKEE